MSVTGFKKLVYGSSCCCLTFVHRRDEAFRLKDLLFLVLPYKFHLERYKFLLQLFKL